MLKDLLKKRFDALLEQYAPLVTIIDEAIHDYVAEIVEDTLLARGSVQLADKVVTSILPRQEKKPTIAGIEVNLAAEPVAPKEEPKPIKSQAKRVSAQKEQEANPDVIIPSTTKGAMTDERRAFAQRLSLANVANPSITNQVKAVVGKYVANPTIPGPWVLFVNEKHFGALAKDLATIDGVDAARLEVAA